MTPKQIVIIIVAIIVLLLVKGIYDKIKAEHILRQKLKDSYGKMPENVYDAGRYEQISYYYEHQMQRHPEKNVAPIDEITWNDLDMELVFMILNQTCTGMGEEYLYAMLHQPEYSKEVLERRNQRVKIFSENEKLREDTGVILKHLGKMKNLSIFAYTDLLLNAMKHNPFGDILMLAALIASILLSVFVSDNFIFLIIVLLAVNMLTYFTYKNRIYFTSFGYVIGIVKQLQKLTQLNAPELAPEMEALKTYLKPILKLGRYKWLFRQGMELGGTLTDLIMDYIKMALHIDLILFDVILSKLKAHQEDLIAILELAGELDADMAIASFRKMKGQWCEPELYESADKTDIQIYAKQLYHPLIEHPVPATFEADRSMLLTGSNASGKSTFLKSVALNAILAQTIYTVMADSYRAPYFRIYSSMALKDNLMGNESYFIVEIKSLKRIYESADEKVPMLCLIDEVLRGTNTVERIAASSQILNQIAQENALCVAATHDIELTYILENIFENWHFKEDICEGEVSFDYELHHGRAVSRNAVKLLGVIGFDNALIQKAEAAGAYFEAHNAWQPIGKNHVADDTTDER